MVNTGILKQGHADICRVTDVGIVFTQVGKAWKEWYGTLVFVTQPNLGPFPECDLFLDDGTHGPIYLKWTPGPHPEGESVEFEGRGPLQTS